MTKKKRDGSKLSKVELKWNICKVMFSGNVEGVFTSFIDV